MKKNPKLVLLIICLGYFVDFYDLTVFSVAYVELFKQQFDILDSTKIQQLYYLTYNIQIAGILVGAVVFGSLADRFGRTTVIKYSILLYSITTIFSVFIDNINIFMATRFLAYLGLASEFAVSSTLIVELFPAKKAAWGMSILYILGVSGGILANLIGIFSYKIMFIFGGLGGLLIYAFRKGLQESPCFIRLYQSDSLKKAGSISFLLKNYSKPLILNFLITLPYFFIITVMFALVKLIAGDANFASLVKLFLFGFFAGNIISCIASGFYNQFFKSPNSFFLINLVIFLLSIFAYKYVSSNSIFLYGIFVGLIGGGYNLMWAQHAIQEFPTQVRSLACNVIFALGRASSIFFGFTIIYQLTNQNTFINSVNLLAAILAITVVLVVLFYKRKKIL